MKKYVNGEYVEISAEEIAAMEAEQAEAEAYERTRPLTAEEVTAMLIRQQINMISVDDATAQRMLEFYPVWAADTDYAAGFKVQHVGKLFRCIQAHTSQIGWEPSTATASLWEQINETHAGTLYDPIPYSGNMALENGKYYTQDGVNYLCIRDTGNPVYHALSALVGLYVEITDSKL